MAAETTVADVQLLVSSTNASASDCDSMTPLSISSDFFNANVLQQSARASDCDVQISFTQISRVDTPVLTPCVVSLSQRAVSGRGTAGNASSKGDCGVLEVEWSIKVQAVSVDVGRTSAYGKITGDDFIGYDVFWH